MTKRLSAAVQPGDKIALLCPGSPCDSQQSVVEVSEYLQRECDWQCVYDAHTWQPCDAAQRATALLEALHDPSIKAIWALRGGEGCADVLPYLERERDSLLALMPKWVAGFSDITPLLVYVSEKLGWLALHTIVARQCVDGSVNPSSVRLALKFLQDEGVLFPVFRDLQPLNAVHSTAPEGEVIAGCLSLFNISIQDCWAFDTRNKLIFIEDVNEKPHAVARTLKYLQRVGFFDGVSAVVAGSFNYLSQDDRVDEWRTQMLSVWLDFAKSCAFPVYSWPYFGHDRDNMLLPVGQKLKLPVVPAITV